MGGVVGEASLEAQAAVGLGDSCAEDGGGIVDQFKEREMERRRVGRRGFVALGVQLQVKGCVGRWTGGRLECEPGDVPAGVGGAEGEGLGGAGGEQGGRCPGGVGVRFGCALPGWEDFDEHAVGGGLSGQGASVQVVVAGGAKTRELQILIERWLDDSAVGREQVAYEVAGGVSKANAQALVGAQVGENEPVFVVAADAQGQFADEVGCGGQAGGLVDGVVFFEIVVAAEAIFVEGQVHAVAGGLVAGGDELQAQGLGACGDVVEIDGGIEALVGCE